MMEQRLVEFASLLRQGGLRVSPGEMVDAVRGLELVELEERDEFRAVLRCSLLKRPQDAPTFDRAFDLFFGGTIELVADLERGLVERLRESGLLDPDSLEMLAHELAHRALSPLAQAALDGDVGKLARLLRGAVLQLNLKGATPLQQGFFGRRLGSAAGLPEAARELAEIEAGLRARGIDPGDLELIADELAETLRSLERTVRDLIGREIAARRPLLRSGLDERPFASVGPDELRAMESAVRRLAAKLKTRFVRRERSRKKGAFNVRRTLRRNLSTGGFPNHLVFRTRRPHRPDVVVLCDVSDSVRNASRLMLLFVHSLQTLFQRVRSFAFVSDLGELTEQLRASDASAAIDIGSIGRAVNLASNSNYGHVFQLFVKRHLAAVTRRTTVLILGDGRNNYNPIHAWALRDLRLKARRVIWISPEPRSSWRLGDSAMLAYERECTQVEVVTCLADLEQLADRLVPV